MPDEIKEAESMYERVGMSKFMLPEPGPDMINTGVTTPAIIAKECWKPILMANKVNKH